MTTLPLDPGNNIIIINYHRLVDFQVNKARNEEESHDDDDHRGRHSIRPKLVEGKNRSMFL